VVNHERMITTEAAKVITGVFKNRWRTLMSVDDLIAETVNVVENELGLADRTFYFYSSDHGFQLGQWNILMDKRHVYDWNTHIHLLVRGPSILRGQIVKAPITNVDLAPTFVDLACGGTCCNRTTGLCVGGASDTSSNTLAPFDGRSVLPLLHSNNTHVIESWRSEVFIEYYYNDPNTKCVDSCIPDAGKYPHCTSIL
jgi:N-acetylglucosamine-6-sulfatase